LAGDAEIKPVWEKRWAYLEKGSSVTKKGRGCSCTKLVVRKQPEEEKLYPLSGGGMGPGMRRVPPEGFSLSRSQGVHDVEKGKESLSITKADRPKGKKQTRERKVGGHRLRDASFVFLLGEAQPDATKQREERRQKRTNLSRAKKGEGYHRRSSHRGRWSARSSKEGVGELGLLKKTA